LHNAGKEAAGKKIPAKKRAAHRSIFAGFWRIFNPNFSACALTISSLLHSQNQLAASDQRTGRPSSCPAG
jgi:hypothetical protein